MYISKTSITKNNQQKYQLGQDLVDKVGGIGFRTSFHGLETSKFFLPVETFTGN